MAQGSYKAERVVPISGGVAKVAPFLANVLLDTRQN